MRKTVPIAVGLAVAALAGVAAGSSAYAERRDELSRMRAAIADAWERADRELLERAAPAGKLAAIAPLGPGLGRAAREAAARVREAGSAPERMMANEKLSEILARALPRIEAAEKEDPDGELARLQNELAAAETRIAQQRRRYNRAVQDYNTALQLFPNNVVAWIAGLEREDAYFRTDEAGRRADPPVRFAPNESEPPEPANGVQ